MSKRLRYQVAVSLDGFIAGPNGEHDWIVMDPEIGAGFAEYYKQFDTFLIGRKTFATVAKPGKKAGGMFAGAGVAGHLALIFLSLALWWALGDLFESLGWSALVVGLVWAVAAAVLAAMGRTRMRKATPVAPRTVDTAKDIPDALKGHETR